MFTFHSLNKIALIFVFSIGAYTGIYAQNMDDSNAVARGGDRVGGDRGFQDQSRYQTQDRRNYPYGGGGYYGGYGGGTAVYPQNPYYYGPPSDAQAFPDDAEAQSIYEQNAHPPR